MSRSLVRAVVGLFAVAFAAGIGCGDVSEPPTPPFGYRRPPGHPSADTSPSRFASYEIVANYNCSGPEHDLLVEELDKREIDWAAGGSIGLGSLLIPSERAEEAREVVRKLAAQTDFHFEIVERDPTSPEKGHK